MTLLLAGLSFKIAAFPFHMWAPMPTRPAARRSSRGFAWRRRRRASSRSSGLYVEGQAPRRWSGMPMVAPFAGMTIVTGNLMAIPQQNIKRLLAYSGIRAHRLHAGRARRVFRARASR
jgi:NADH-quinone oxidoreductase subunit N